MKNKHCKWDIRKTTLITGILVSTIFLSACMKGGNPSGSDKDSGNNEINSSGQNVSGESSNNLKESGYDKNNSVQTAKDLAGQLGIDMPDNIISLSDPDQIYKSGNVIQMKNDDLFITMETASDWLDSEAGLSSGKKYISVPIRLIDYGFGTKKQIYDPSHFYIIEARDGNGSTVNLGAKALRPKTDMPVSEIKSNPEQYYTSVKPLDVEDDNLGMKLWLLYEVPVDTREITVACWLNDEFTKPFDTAYRLRVNEKQITHNFEHESRDEILKAVQTDERPDLEDFSWYRHDLFDHLNMSGSRDPAYDGYEYEGGWKCWILCDRRPWKKGLEAHLCNLYVENFVPEDSSNPDKGNVDVRIEWYLGLDENGKVTDESGKPDTICTHEAFFYNRMNNDDSNYPFASFSFEYIDNRAVGWGRYVNEDKEEYKLAVVRPNGKNLWIMEGDPSAFAMLPGTKDVPVPADLLASAKSSGSKSSDSKSSESKSSESKSSETKSSSEKNKSKNKGSSSFLPKDNASSEKSSESSDKKGKSKKSDGNIGKNNKSSGTATLNDFNWYFEDDFPIDGNVLTELQDLGGNWKGIINVVTPVDGEDQCRMSVNDIEVQYMGYKMTLLMTPRESYEFFVNDPDNMTKRETSPDIGAMVFKGDWNDESGFIDAETESGLGVIIYDFVEAGGVQYAMGSVFNRDNEIGEIAMFR